MACSDRHRELPIVPRATNRRASYRRRFAFAAGRRLVFFAEGRFFVPERFFAADLFFAAFFAFGRDFLAAALAFGRDVAFLAVFLAPFFAAGLAAAADVSA